MTKTTTSCDPDLTHCDDPGTRSVSRWTLISAVWLALLAHNFPAVADTYPGMPSGEKGYQELVTVYDEFLQWVNSEKLHKDRPFTDVAGQAAVLHPNYDGEAVAQRRDAIKKFHQRLSAMAVHEWPQSQQAEFLAVRARVDQEHFNLHITRPWSRDPGFYIDRVLRLTFADLPLKGSDLQQLQVQLAAVPLLMSQAKNNLNDVAADYADLALFNLSNADGVGHGFPYRSSPPAGVIGWYQDLQARAETQQPELLDAIIAAKRSIEGFDAWLKSNRSVMNAKAGVGRDNFNWYLKHVKLLPYTTDEIVVLGERELDRLWSVYALERHRNRNLPEIKLPKTAAEYQQRIDSTDRRIVDFLEREDIITIPDYIGKLETNVPWIVREKGPNFWEQIQYRDPTPDHLHAVIPGHRFDAVVERNNTHPIRGRITDGVRTEGWGVYLEEAIMHAGLLDELDSGPRVRELIYLFGIFRAARMPVDVWLQQNDMTVSKAVDYWLERVPYLDADVARVDAEIYLRRPPGYGLGYMAGMIQMQTLLAERKRQLKEAFSLREFHDTVMQSGRLPITLLRWEMTGQDDEVKSLWSRTPLPQFTQKANSKPREHGRAKPNSPEPNSPELNSPDLNNQEPKYVEADIAWIAKGGFCEPETVLPLPDNTLLVSNICDFRTKGDGYLTLLDAKGNTMHWRKVDHLDSPLGMALSGSRLHVVDTNAVKVFQWPDFELIETFEMNTRVANDIAVSDDGTIYVTDSATHQVIRRLPNGSLSVIASDFEFKNANGIALYGNGLYVGGAHLWRVNLSTESVETFTHDKLLDIDGIEFEADGTMQITPVGGPLIRYRTADDLEIVAGRGISSANHGFAQALNLALIPTGYDNTVIAIRVP